MSNIDDILPLPDQAVVRMLAPDILVMQSVVPAWRDELIEISEKIKCYQQSNQSLHNTSGNDYQDANRTSQSFLVTAANPDFGPCLRRFEEALIRAFHTGACAYKTYNEHLTITHDSGFEMLRYHEGERFGLHVDAILGRNEGFRQLSGLLYLNDDYEGGETYFPRQKLKFKATAGDLLLFPSTFCYPHESLPVTHGTKYAVVTWFMAYPKPSEQNEEPHGEQDEGDADGTSAVDDGGLCLLGSARSGSDAGEPTPPDRERASSVG